MSDSFQARDLKRFEAALRRFDEENARDPNHEVVDGVSHPRELLYAQRLANWVLRLCPGASEELRLAARCQHICRWEIPRFPSDDPRRIPAMARGPEKVSRPKSRRDFARGRLRRRRVRRVQDLNLKKNFPNDPEARVLEDALCLVFLEFQLAGLAAKTAEDKMINALRKSWQKMTEPARAEALKLNFGPREKALLERALAPLDV